MLTSQMPHKVPHSSGTVFHPGGHPPPTPPPEIHHASPLAERENIFDHSLGMKDIPCLIKHVLIDTV